MGIMQGARASVARSAPVLALVALLAHPEHALASGYAVGHESVSGAGTAYAGGAAAASDASTIHSNPAGLIRLERHEVTFGGHHIRPNVDFDNRGSTIFDGTALTGSNGGNGGVDALVPNLFAAWNYRDDIKFGLGVTAPYGLVTKYDAPWLGRYNEITTLLKVINVNPSAAFRVSDRVSVGAGLNLQYAQANLIQAVDYGTICLTLTTLATCTALGLLPQQSDGGAQVEGSDFGYGYNVGVLVELNPRTRLGMHYRSHVHLTLDLDATFFKPAAATALFTAGGNPTAFTDTGAETEITIPETLSLSVYHDINPKWALMGDLTWTRWSRFDELRINYDDTATPSTILPTQWSNVFRAAVGAAYEWRDDVVLRAGLAFDDSPIATQFRGPGIPDSDRYILALGGGYRPTDSITVNAAYQHFFFKNGTARRVSGTNSTLNGEFFVDADIFSLGLTWRF